MDMNFMNFVSKEVKNFIWIHNYIYKKTLLYS